ncbi:MAG: DUF3024 domain-containing protein [Cytophagales bacterium]|nr:DUF3024 domain-containing protein [Cytophagales bacterium]
MAKTIDFTEARIRQYIEAMRPPEEIRDQLDIAYTYEKNTLVIMEVFPGWLDESVKEHLEVAKARYFKTKKIWKIYWMRAGKRWEAYHPMPEANDISVFFEELAKDEFGFFW